MLLLIMFSQSLPVRPDYSVVTQSTRQTLVHMRQQMQIANVSFVKDKRTEWTAEVDATCTMLGLLWTVFQMTLHLTAVSNRYAFTSA